MNRTATLPIVDSADRSRRHPAALVLLALLAAVGVATSAQAEPQAVIAQLKGIVSVTPAKSQSARRVALGRTLERGDKVQVGAGGSATLFFNDGNMIELGEKSTMTIGGRMTSGGATAAKGALPAEVFAKVSRFVVSDARPSGMMALAPLRGSGDDPLPMLLTPRRSSVRSDQPAFRWRSVEGATRYRITVSGDQGDLWSREVTEASLAYPADAASLATGADYLWKVQALSDQGPLRDEETTFSVLASEDSARVTTDLADLDKATDASSTAASIYLAGSYLVGRGLYGEAAQKFEALVKLSPDAPGPHEALGSVYRTIGLLDLATAEYQRALELSRVP